jgi:hypothetical protein
MSFDVGMATIKADKIADGLVVVGVGLVLQGRALGGDGDVCGREFLGETRKPKERKREGKEWSEQAGSGWRRFCIIEEPGRMGGRGGRQGGAKQGALSQAWFTQSGHRVATGHLRFPATPASSLWVTGSQGGAATKTWAAPSS